MKLETCLRMAALPFEMVNSGNVMKAPEGKLPYIDDGGTLVADTTFVIDDLKGRYGDPLDGALSPRERAVSTAFQRLIEEDLYWAVAHVRWAEDAGWAKTREAFFGAIPAQRGADLRHRLPRRDGDRGLPGRHWKPIANA
jgi:Glutathione S-transferase N-terminal domain